MKATKFILAMLVLAVAGIGSASAHGPRARVGVYFGAPVFGPVWGPAWGPGWYPPPYYYPPPQVIVVPPAQPPVYVEQNPPLEEASTAYWYYCKSARNYYPNVKECPDGWQKVLPQTER